jgi:GNAT superfamily N-acetyltransferase
MEGVTFERLSNVSDDVLGFVLRAWLRSYEARGMQCHGIDKRTYYRTHHPELIRLLRANGVVLARVTDSPDVYCGFAVGAPGVLHAVYVKAPCRGVGVGRELVRIACGDAPGVYTFEPGQRDGRARATLVRVAERKRWRFHPHPVPGVEVRKQLQQARENETT